MKSTQIALKITLTRIVSNFCIAPQLPPPSLKSWSRHCKGSILQFSIFAILQGILWREISVP